MKAFEPLLTAVRTRLRIAWALDRATRALALTGIALLALFAVSVWVPLGRIATYAWAALGLVSVAVAARAATMRVPLLVAARATDRGLSARDQVTTAVELLARGPSGDIEPLQVDRAARVVAGQRARDIVGLSLPGRPTGIAFATIVLAILAAWLPTPADATAGQRAAEAAAIQEQRELAIRLAEQAAASASTERQRELVEALEELAKQLDEAQTLEEAERALDGTESALLGQLDPEALPKRAAVAGLERSLATDPLPGSMERETATDQLGDLARQLGSLGEAAREQAASRLQAAGEAMASTHPELAAALIGAARDLRSGTARSAQGELQHAASLQSGALSDAIDQDWVAGTISSLGQMRGALSDAAQTPRSGQSAAAQQPGEQGSGAQGASAQGAGAQGATAGGGAGRGSSDGNGSGVTSGTGAADASIAQVPAGFESSGSNAGGYNTGDSIASGGIYDPASLQGTGNEQQATGQLGNDLGGEILQGGERGIGERGEILVPFQHVLAAYREAFVRAVQTETIPVGARSLVRLYFQALIEAGS